MKKVPVPRIVLYKHSNSQKNFKKFKNNPTFYKDMNNIININSFKTKKAKADSTGGKKQTMNLSKKDLQKINELKKIKKNLVNLIFEISALINELDNIEL